MKLKEEAGISFETSSEWTDFSNAPDQKEFAIIPKGTLAKVCMKIQPGGYNDASRGWTGNWATQNINTGSVYLKCEFTIMNGEYAKRKIFGLIGLHSPKGPNWQDMGKSFIKGILSSAHGFSSKDKSPDAKLAQRIKGFEDLDEIEFIALIDIEKNQHGYDDKNVIKRAITAEHKEYASLMGTPHKSKSSSDNLPPWAQ